MCAAFFDRFHSAVSALFFAVVLVLTMAAFHPVFQVLSFAAACACNTCLRGARSLLKTMLWQIPLVVIIAVANFLFSAAGSTELLHFGTRAFFAEALAYGACMGLMFASVMLWLSCATQVLTSDKLMGLTGSVAPVIGLMLSMVMRLVPQFVRRGAEIDLVARAATSAHGAGSTASPALSDRVRQMSVLMGWSMENSLETSDAMRARGWGAASKRTAYSRRRFTRADGCAVAALLVLVILTAASCVYACMTFSFYPTVGPVVSWPFCLPFAILVALPLLGTCFECFVWRGSR